MEQYILSFLLKSLVITAIILAVSILNALFGRAFPAKLRYAIWLVVLAGLIIPLPFAIGSGMITVPMPASTQMHYAEWEGAAAELPMETTPITAYTDTMSVSIFTICVFVWGIVALAVFAWHMRQYACFLRTIKRWGQTVQDENVLRVFHAVQAEMGLERKNIDLKLCGFVSSSMLTGFLRPVILLPEKHFETDELNLIFRHELIHYKRRDLLIKLMSVIAISIYWFNPLIYWMCEAMQTDGEASCDEEVLLDSDKENRHFYAEVIIGMIGGKNTAVTMLSTCFFYRGKFSIKRRLDAIMDTTLKMKWPSILVLMIVMMLTLFSGSVFAFAIQEFPAIIIPPNFVPELPLSVGGSMQVALARVGGGTVEEIELEHINGMPVYSVTVRNGRWKYEIKIDTVTGQVVDFEREAAFFFRTSYRTQVSFEQAIETAIVRIGGGALEEIELDHKNGLLIYEVEIKYNNRHYEVKIDAVTGAVLLVEQL